MSANWFKPVPTDYTVINVNSLPSGDYLLPSNSILKGPGKLPGRVVMSAHSWIIDCEGASLGAGDFITANNPDCNIVNCYLHGGVLGSVGILTGGGSASYGGVFYGNIIFGMQHCIYSQNSDITDPRYFVHNVVGDVVPSGNSRAIHSYTEQAQNELGLKFYENVVMNGPCILGGAGAATAPLGCQFIGGIFYNSSLSAYHLHNDALIKKNRFYRSICENEFFWPGEDGSILNNSFYSLDMNQQYLHLLTEDLVRLSSLVSIPVVDHNQYYGHFLNALGADGKFYADVTRIEDWRTYSENAGAEFDAAGAFHTNPPPNMSHYYPNAYDPTRALVVVENWRGKPVPVKTYGKHLYAVRDPFGPAVYGPDPLVIEPEISAWIAR